MKRIDKNADSRKQSFWITLGAGLAILFTIGTCITYSLLVDNENVKIREFILNYDKTADVYQLQQDFKEKF